VNKWAVGIGAVALLIAAVWVIGNGTKGGSDIEYRYAPVAKGDLFRSTSSTGVLVPLTKVDVKSKAGGKVVKLLVEEGSPVQIGQTIAYIDPEDTKSVFQQAEADVTTARTRVSQARTNAQMEAQNAVNRVKDAEIALSLARVRLDKAESTARAQPALSSADLRSAQAGLDSANQALRTTVEIQIPQKKRDAEGQYNRAKADLDAADAELTRQKKLLALGYVAQNSVERQQATLAASRSTFRLAEQRLKTIDTEVDADLKTAQLQVRQAEQTLAQAKANQNRVPISARDLDEARQNVKAAEIALKEAQTQRLNVQLRQQDVTSASAGAVRSQVAMQNAKIQLDSTTVVAPRTGIVTMKYLEEGTIIPPGTSTFAQGTSLVQIADTTQMFVECTVDEADIGNVRIDQPVRIIVEAYPGQEFDGTVKKIFPAAETANALTTVKVRVQIIGNAPKAAKLPEGAGGGGNGKRARHDDGKPAQVVLRPGMNATCEFVQFSKKQVLIVPQQAINRDGDKVTVRVKTSDDKNPEVRTIKVGASGNEGVEVLEGLKEGEQVVVAEIDLKAMRDRQAKMDAAAQGGGFGSSTKGGPAKSLATSGGSGGGAKGGGK